MLNENIKNIRLAHNMSQVELAAKLGVSKQSVSNWENDNIQPSVEMLVKIAKCLCVSTDCLWVSAQKKPLTLQDLQIFKSHT